MACIRDKFWLWGHRAGSHDKAYNLPEGSCITPVEAACYMGIPNSLMVGYSGAPVPLSVPEVVPFKALDRVVWSIVGAGGRHSAEVTAKVLELPQLLPNMTGVIMDDFFGEAKEGQEVGAFGVAELEDVRRRLCTPERRLDLWIVLYANQLGMPVREHLALCDILTFWTWKACDLKDLERSFAAAEKLAPDCGKILGCYMWDYGDRGPMPVELMQQQCETGLKWLREGRIEGIIFLASCICDLQLEAVEWTRQWIAEVGGASL